MNETYTLSLVRIKGRITGWWQNGPLSQAAGHDINFIALSGALHAFTACLWASKSQSRISIEHAWRLWWWGMMLAFGITCGILEVQQSGKIQIVDASGMEGTARSANASTYSGRAQENHIERLGIFQILN
ncbi:MAG: CoA transferase [Deltaproteobacteria bacterium]|nr:CoA transferase [Candidatus Desulfobacula maris]